MSAAPKRIWHSKQAPTYPEWLHFKFERPLTVRRLYLQNQDIHPERSPALFALMAASLSKASVTTTAGTLAWFGIGLIGFSAYLYTVRAMYAHLDTRTPFFVNVLERVLAR